MTDIVLQTCSLTKRYGDTLAVDRLSLEITRGEIFGFLGPNGAGKTTSIKMMVGLIDPSEGYVLIEGRSIRERQASALRCVGVCSQENILWEKLTCLEQLEFVGANYGLSNQHARKNGAALLEELGLASKANELAGRLSGGMKRRLNLALALVHDPQIVFLDEPEAGLDPQSRVLVREMIRRLAQRKTVVLSTHNMDEAERLASRVAIIDHGRLLVVDTPVALKRRLGIEGLLEIEIDLPGGHVDPLEDSRLLDCLRPIFPGAQLAGGLLTLPGMSLATRLAEALVLIEAGGRRTGSIHIRTVTLEDVFLSLTGRGLRE
jgi:ABC-2 type transport system ATP-binding protein